MAHTAHCGSRDNTERRAAPTPRHGRHRRVSGTRVKLPLRRPLCGIAAPPSIATNSHRASRHSASAFCKRARRAATTVPLALPRGCESEWRCDAGVDLPSRCVLCCVPVLQPTSRHDRSSAARRVARGSDLRCRRVVAIAARSARCAWPEGRRLHRRDSRWRWPRHRRSRSHHLLRGHQHRRMDAEQRGIHSGRRGSLDDLRSQHDHVSGGHPIAGRMQQLLGSHSY